MVSSDLGTPNRMAMFLLLHFTSIWHSGDATLTSTSTYLLMGAVSESIDRCSELTSTSTYLSFMKSSCMAGGHGTFIEITAICCRLFTTTLKDWYLVSGSEG